MKYLITICLLSLSFLTTAQREVSMSDTYGKRHEGMYRYFEKGVNQPYSGVLYAKYENGNYKSYQYYENGIGEGAWINYYEDGTVKEAGTYKNDKVEGPIKKYYPSGQLKSEGTYKDWRIRVGVWNYYSEEGKITQTVDHGTKGDFRDVEYYYQTGQISKRFYLEVKSR